MTDFTTISPDQLPPLTEVTADTQLVAFQTGGPLAKVPANSGMAAGVLGYSEEEDYPLGSVGGKLRNLPVNPQNAPYYATVAGVVDDTTAFRDGMLAARRDGRPFEWDGTALITGKLDLDGIDFRGSGQRKSILKVSGNTDLFEVGDSWCKASGFRVDNSLRTGGTDVVFNIAESGGSVEHDFEDIHFDGSRGCVKDNYVAGAGLEYRTYFKRVKWGKVAAGGIHHTRAFGYIFYDAECALEKLFAPTAPNFTLFTYDGSSLPGDGGGLILDLTLVGNHDHAGADHRDVGLHINHGAAVYLKSSFRAEAFKGRGIWAQNASNLHFQGAGSFQCGGLADPASGLANGSVLIQDSTYSYGEGGLSVTGRRGIGVPTANSHGVLFKGGDNHELGWVAAHDNTGSGVASVGTLQSSITYLNAKNNARYMFEADATTGAFHVYSARGKGNTLANYSSASPHVRLRNIGRNDDTILASHDGVGTA